ncbi:uncharacterized protein LOC122369469 [Amphibalanus amphitrite]|uniref:uncharacterized protein LOC122369469 n=1 Tax=Amphibalanus amphitrite TaxID=1232801 RepID=UPI001C905619|nr:uncharacterized protein LOC122369469 [Amphibalanus amphitrite]
MTALWLSHSVPALCDNDRAPAVADPSAVASVRWFNKDRPVPLGDRCSADNDSDGSWRLQLAAAELTDDGQWRAEVTGAAGGVTDTWCTVILAVPRNYRKPRFLETLRALLTDEGLVSFECKVVGYPTPVLRWFKDGQELKPGDVYQLSGTNSLGVYACLARNCMGTAESTAELTLADIENQLSDEERCKVCQGQLAPRFSRALSPETVVGIGDRHRFTVEVTSYPEAEVAWYREQEKEPVQTSDSVSTGREAPGRHHLQLEGVQLQHQGEWRCVATNPAGQAVTTGRLTVNRPKHYRAPYFLEPLRASLTESGTVNLQCKVVGTPQPVLQWFKDGAELKAGDIHRITSGGDGTCCLGSYTCRAVNCMGSASSTAELMGLEEMKRLKGEHGPPAPAAGQHREPFGLARNTSLSTINEERTSQMMSLLETAQLGTDTFQTPALDGSVVSVVVDGQEVSAAVFGTGDVSLQQVHDILEAYGEQLSEEPHSAALSGGGDADIPSLRVLTACAMSGNVQLGATVIDVSLVPADQLPALHADDDARTEAEIDDLNTDRPTDCLSERPAERPDARPSERASEQTTEVDRPTDGHTDWATELPTDRPSELRSPTEMRSPPESRAAEPAAVEHSTAQPGAQPEQQTAAPVSPEPAAAPAPVSESSSRSSKKRRAARRNTQPLKREDLPPRPTSGELASAADTLSTVDSFHTADAMEPSYASDDPTSGQITPVPNEEVFDYENVEVTRLPPADLLEKALASRDGQFSPVFFGGEDVQLAEDGAVTTELLPESLDQRLSRYMFGETEAAAQLATHPDECPGQLATELQQAAPQQDLSPTQPGTVSRRPLLLSPAVSQKSEDSNRGLSFDEEVSPEAYEAHLTSQGVVAVMHAVVTGEHLPEEYLGEIGRALTPQEARMTLTEEGARDRAGLVMRLFSAALSNQELSQGVLEEVEQALAPDAPAEPLTQEAATAVKALVEVLETAQFGDPKVIQSRGKSPTLSSDVLEMAAETLPGIDEKASANKILTLFLKLPEVAQTVREVKTEASTEIVQHQTRNVAHQAARIMQEAMTSDVTNAGTQKEPVTSTEVTEALSSKAAAKASERLIDIFQAISQGEVVPEEPLREVEKTLVPSAAQAIEEHEPKLTVDKLMALVTPVLEETASTSSTAELPRALSPQVAQERSVSGGACDKAQRLLTVLHAALTSETNTDNSLSDLTQTLSPTEPVITEVPRDDRSGAVRVLAAVQAAMQDLIVPDEEVSQIQSVDSPTFAKEACASEGPRLNVQKLMTVLQAATADDVVSEGTLSDISSLSQQQAGENLAPDNMKATAEKVLNILQTTPIEEVISDGSLSGLSSQPESRKAEIREDQADLIERVTAIMRGVISGVYVPDEEALALRSAGSPAVAESAVVADDSKRRADIILTELHAMLRQDAAESDASGTISPIRCESASAVPSHEDKLETAAKLMMILHADPLSPSISEGSLSDMSSIQDPSLASTRDQSGDALQLAVATKVLAAARAAQTECVVSEGEVTNIDRALSPQEAREILTPGDISLAVQKALEILQSVCVSEDVPQDSIHELERVLSPVKCIPRTASPLVGTEVTQETGVEVASSAPNMQSMVETANATGRVTSPLQETLIVEATCAEMADSTAASQAPETIEERVITPLQTACTTETTVMQDIAGNNSVLTAQVEEEQTPSLQPLQITETVSSDAVDLISDITTPTEAGEGITSPLQILQVEETGAVERETESLPSLASSAKAEDRVISPLQSTQFTDIAILEDLQGLNDTESLKANATPSTALQTTEATDVSSLGVDDFQVETNAKFLETSESPLETLQVIEPHELTNVNPTPKAPEPSLSETSSQVEPASSGKVTEIAASACSEATEATKPLAGVDEADYKVMSDESQSPMVAKPSVEVLSGTSTASEKQQVAVAPKEDVLLLESQTENVNTASGKVAEVMQQETISTDDVEMQGEDTTSLKSSDSVITVASLKQQESDELPGDSSGALQQPSEVQQALQSMESLTSAVCAAATATLSPEQAAEGRVEVLANDFLESLESLCGGLESDRQRVLLNKLCDKVKVNDKLSQEASANPDTMQALEGISPMVHRTLYPKVNQVCEEIERLAMDAGPLGGSSPKSSVSGRSLEDAIGDQLQRFIDAVEETNQMKLRSLKHPVDDNSIARKFDDINDSVVHLAETVKKIVSSAMTGSADLSLQVTAVQQSLAVAVVTLTDLISNDELRDEAIRLLASVNGGISRVSDAVENSARALKSDDSPEMSLAIQALLDDILGDIVAATNKFKDGMRDVTATVKEAAANSAEDGISKFLMQGEAFDAEVEDLTIAIESITAKKKRVAADVKSMKKISAESSNVRSNIDATLKLICNIVTGAPKSDEDQTLKEMLTKVDLQLKSLGQKFCNSIALPQPSKEQIAQKINTLQASLAKLVSVCVQNSELLRIAKDAKVKRRSLSPNQSRVVQDLENIRTSFDQAIVQMRLMLASQHPGESTDKLFENMEAMSKALSSAEKSVLACAGTAASAPQHTVQEEGAMQIHVADLSDEQRKEEDATPEPKSLNEASASLNASVTSLTEVVEEKAQLKLPSATSIEDLTWSVCETVQSFIAAVQTSTAMHVDEQQVQQLNDALAALTATVADTPSEACAALDDTSSELCGTNVGH